MIIQILRNEEALTNAEKSIARYLLNRENDIEVKWKEITKIGEDVILVKTESL